MKIQSRSISALRIPTKIRRSQRVSRILADVCEQLESRLLLAGTVDPTKYYLPTNPTKEIAPSQNFRAGRGKTTTVPAPGLNSLPAQINVGSVVNISRVAGNQTEADIAINPTNPDQVFAVSNHSSTGLFSSRSNDGGVNWTTAVIAAGGADGLPVACCDARVEYDAFGNLWMTYLNSSASSNLVARSVNNGQTWTVVDTKTGGWDNPDLGVGANNQIWVTARRTGTSAGPSGVAAYGALSTGLGAAITFSAVQLVPTTGSTGSFGDVAVANDGSILVSYVTPTSGEGPSNVPIWRDADGLGPQGFVGLGGSLTVPVLNTPTNVGGFDFIPAQNGRSVDPECSFAVVPPGRPFAGRVYFMYANEVVNESHNHDIVIRYSDDNGLTWSNEVRVNDDPASPVRSQFLGQIAVDPTTGAVVVSWHDARNDNGVVPNGSDAVQNNEAQFYGALSTDGGLTWTNFQIDPGWSNEVRAASGIDFGDWTGSDFYGGRFFAVWASNAVGTNGLPNNPAPNNFDLATARVDIIGAGLPGIYGIAFDDANGNGAKDAGEGGLAGVTVYIDANNNSIPDGGDTTTTTAVGGSYSFTSLAAGVYTIRSVAPAGQRITFPGSGFYNVNFDGTSALAGEDFGFVNPRIAGTVFDDTNDNGVFDGAELGLAGVTVFIDADLSGGLTAGDPTTTSAANGTYTLGGLANGSYVVRAVTPAGRRLTFPGSGSFSHTVTNAALVFAGDNFGFTNRVRISGFVYRDANGNGTKDGGEIPYVGRRVYQDLNNSGTFDNTGGTFSSTNVPLVINDNTTINSTLNVAGGGNINNLTVKLNITHTFDGDLVISLISPLGTTVTLANRRGGTGENFNDTIFDDAAATSIVNGVPPYAGSFRPETPLSALNGQNANGTWTLRVQDAATTDTGSLNSWSITFGSTEPNVLTDVNGAYSFPGLSAGTHNIRAEAPANTVFTNPTNGLRQFTAVGGELFAGDFGLFPTAYTGQDITLRLDPTGTNTQIWIDESLANPPTFTADKTIISSLTFTGTAGTDSLTVDAANGNPLPPLGASYDGLAGTNTLSLKGSTGAESLVFNDAASAAINGILVNTTNTNVFRADGRGGNDTINVNGSANVFIDNTQHLQQLFIASFGVATVPAGQNAVIVTNNLSLNGRMDLNDNDMILTYTGATQLGTIQALINSARNNGLWDGQGLTSTSAKNRVPANTTLAAIEASDYQLVNGPSATFDGETIDTTTVLVKYTYYGDTDFNGSVDFDDYSRIDAGFNNNRTGWLNGDVDYNGIVDFDDYSLIDQAFNTQSGTLRRAISYLDGSDRSDKGMDAPSLQLVQQHLQQFGEQYAAGFLNAVPEPTSTLAISGLTALAASGRRRRRSA